MKKIFLSVLAIVVAFAANAQDSTASSGISFYDVMLGIMIILAIVLLFTVITLQSAVTSLKNQIGSGKHTPEQTLTTWEKLLSLKPLANEKDIELDHDYDGIKELNNPIPVWFNVLFYGTVVFAICYLIIYHMIGAAPLQTKEYMNELDAAKIQKEAYLKKAGNLIDENNVVQIKDAAKLSDAKKIFTERCIVCHGANAQGIVGPNLTDEYWLHGGKVNDIFKTIKYGVQAKGMVPWGGVLKPNEIQIVASYILSLQGSNPPGAKAPQGEKMQGAIASSDSTQKDTSATVKK